MSTAVIGGGCIGLAVAGELAADHDVTLFERDQLGRGSSYAAAGMLGPIMEVEFHEEELLGLGLESHRQYPAFVEALTEETGVDPDLRTQGTLYVAVDPPEVEEMNRLYEYQRRIDLEVQRLSAEEARELEPRITHYVAEAMYTSTDHQVDNRRLIKALAERCREREVQIHEQTPVESLETSGGSVEAVRTPEATHEFDQVVLAAGSWSGDIDGIPAAERPPIRPVKGQALSIGLSEDPEIEHVVRSPDVYCVPKSDGRMVVGSTMEEEGYDDTVTAGGVLDLLHQAYELLPFVYDQPLLETWAGLRPASHDSLPIIGPSPNLDGLVYATGHYRNGILMTPVTADLIGRWFRDRTVPELMEPFLPDRLVESPVGS